MGETAGAVVWGPANAMARGASGVALEFSQGLPGWRTVASPSRAPSHLHWRLTAQRLPARRQDAARRLVAPWRYPSLSAALAAGRERQPRPSKYSRQFAARAVEQRCFRDLLVASSN